MKSVICPLIGGNIDGDACYKIVLVVDGEAPIRILPDNIKITSESRKVCRACKYHADEKLND